MLLVALSQEKALKDHGASITEVNTTEHPAVNCDIPMMGYDGMMYDGKQISHFFFKELPVQAMAYSNGLGMIVVHSSVSMHTVPKIPQTTPGVDEVPKYGYTPSTSLNY